MEKLYKLNGEIYGKTNGIRLSCKYVKENGYFACVEGVELLESIPGIYGKCFCKEYYETGGDGMYFITESKRRNKKKEATTWEIILNNADNYIKAFLIKKNRSELSYQEV